LDLTNPLPPPITCQAKLAGGVGGGPGGITRGIPFRVYDNTASTSLFLADVQPHRAGDDGSFAGVPGSGVIVTCVEFGMYVNPGANGEADFDAYCLFYDTLNPNATPVNSDFIAGFFLELRGIQGEVAYTTGMIDLAPIFPDGIRIPDRNWFVDLRFYQPGSTTLLSARATPMFSGTGVLVGASEDVYWRDADDNGLYDPTDARFFGGGTSLANFYLAIDGVPLLPPCPCDFNRDAALNSQDFFDFLISFFAVSPEADFNADGVVNSQDFFDFLACFFTGCP
jgi:hypothetical protein